MCIQQQIVTFDFLNTVQRELPAGALAAVAPARRVLLALDETTSFTGISLKTFPISLIPQFAVARGPPLGMRGKFLAGISVGSSKGTNGC